MGLRKVVKKLIPRGLFQKIEPFGHLIEAVIFNIIYLFPARHFKIIGVTGTNGKTTTSFLIHRMLHEAGYKVGLMSTVGYGAGLEIKPQMQHMTNVSVPQLMKRLKWMRSQNVEWLVMETTSHALAQHRVWAVPYSIAVFTNITHEHLAYHKTFERYIAAKRMLFEQTDKNKKGLRAGVINADDPRAETYITAVHNPLTYGIYAGDVRATNVNMSATGVTYETRLGDETLSIKTRLPGSFNVYNSLAAAAVGQLVGLNKEQIEQGIYALEGVEGRMTQIDEGQKFDLIVDYAHSPDSFEKLFKDIKPVVKGRLIVLFGSLGGGDVGKRAIQGKLAGEYADLVIVTEEDDRLEDPKQIMTNIADGAKQAGKTEGKDLVLIHDRTEAIQYAVNNAQASDVVLLLGKGHEKTIEDANGERPWNEIATARKALADLKSTKS